MPKAQTTELGKPSSVHGAGEEISEAVNTNRAKIDIIKE
jgi:cysteine sulfinate desulfinase/cysteine desulfurase-like protein